MFSLRKREQELLFMDNSPGEELQDTISVMAGMEQMDSDKQVKKKAELRVVITGN